MGVGDKAAERRVRPDGIRARDEENAYFSAGILQRIGCAGWPYHYLSRMRYARWHSNKTQYNGQGFELSSRLRSFLPVAISRIFARRVETLLYRALRAECPCGT